MNLYAMLPLLRCPRTGAHLRIWADTLVAEGGQTYPIVNGKPILVRNIRPMHLTPPDARVVSQNTSSWEPGAECDKFRTIVNLGSGNVPSSDPRVISIDVLPNANVDLVCEAEALPFADNSIDYIASGAVFEHVHSPLQAIAEVKRVLSEDGEFRIDTAFMQGYHGFPGHYFNMTPQACETFLVDDFALMESGATGDAAIFHPIVNGLTFALEALPEKDRKAFMALSVGEAMELMRDKTPPQWVGRVTELMRRSYAAQYVVHASKPIDHRARTMQAAEKVGANEWATLKRDYYAARMGLIMEHHGIVHFKMRAVEDFGVDPGTESIPDLNALLRKHLVVDHGNPADWLRKTLELENERVWLVASRDGWIVKFLTAQEQRAALTSTVDMPRVATGSR